MYMNDNELQFFQEQLQHTKRSLYWIQHHEHNPINYSLSKARLIVKYYEHIIALLEKEMEKQ